MEEEIRNQVALFTHSNSLPKIELHAHLNGSIRKSTLIELLSQEDKDKLEELYPKMDFLTAMKFFSITSKIITDLSIVRRITREMIEDWNKHNVMYMEIRTTLKSKPNLFSKEEYLYAVLDEINKGNKKYDIITRLIISLDREKSIEDYEDTLQIYKNFKDGELKKLIVGIDYCGNEINEKHKYQEIIPILQQFRDEGLKITVHMGESPNYQIFPFDEFRPDRVSHAYFFKDIHYHQFMKRKIPVEVCPTLSYKITHATDFSKIPMSNFYNKKIEDEEGKEFVYDLISINTDDVMLVLTDISQEYFEVASNFGMTIKDLKNIIIKTIDTIFEKDENVRNKLREKINNYPC